MPFLEVQLVRGSTVEQRRAFAARAAEVCVETLGTKTPADVDVVFLQLDADEIAVGGVLGDPANPPRTVAITVRMFRGRTREQVDAFFASITDCAVRTLDVATDAVRVNVLEFAPEAMAFGGESAAH
jgi:4-oxalocrotonate tautomerase